MAKGKFLRGAIWLTLTGAALRAVGMAYRVFISARLGEEGMGLYQLILSVYMLGSAFASAGVSVAVTRLVSMQTVSGGREGVERILRFSLWWSMGIGGAVAAVMAVGAPLIAARFIGDPAAAAGIRILSLGLPCMSAAACFNGYFLGVGRVSASCITQIIEQATRIAVTVLLIDRGIVAVFIGNALSELAAAGLLALFCLTDLKRLQHGGETTRNIYARFLPIQLPIAAGRYITSGLHTAENLLVPVQLSKFSGRVTALGDFGALKGMALPLIMFPSSFLSSLAGLLVPELTAAATLRQQEKVRFITRRVLHLTFLFSILMGGVFFRFGSPLARLIYGSDSVGEILCFLSPAIPFMYLDCITDGLLKGTGEQMASLRYSTADSLMRIALVFLLLPKMGLRGFLYIMIISNCTVALLGLRRLLKVTECAAPWKNGVLLPFVGVLLAQFVTLPIQNLLLSAVVYLAVFILFILCSGALNIRELLSLFPALTRKKLPSHNMR